MLIKANGSKSNFKYILSEVKESYPSICDDVVGNPDLRALWFPNYV